MTATAKSFAAGNFAIAMLAKAQRMLEKATTVKQIRNAENLAQRAREYAKAAAMGRDSVNAAARCALDARRKAGAALMTMREWGKLAERGKPKKHARGISTLPDLGLTRSQASYYQQEASVPQRIYEKWVREVMASDDRMLSAAGLRALARDEDESPLSYDAAARRMRRFVASLANRMSPEGRTRRPRLLISLSHELKRLPIR